MTPTDHELASVAAAELDRGTTDALATQYIDHWAQRLTDEPVVTFIDYAASRKGVEDVISYGEMDRRTRALAARVARLAQPGDRIAMLVPQSAHYVTAFMAMLRTDFVSVPLFAPDLPGQGDRLEQVVADCDPSVVLTTRDKLDLVIGFCREHTGLGPERVLCVDDLDGLDDDAAEFQQPTIGLDDLAYLQYTSGSTRIPAGVELTHRNLVTNVMQIVEGHGAELGGKTATVSWLPLFHDMGLLLGAAGPCIGAAHAVLMDPIAFLMKPVRWLEACHGRDRVITSAPNFAYDFARKRIKEEHSADLDLSGVTSWANGAEPILPSTLDAFVERFAANGVTRGSLCPTYGLAEATVMVTVTPPQEEPVAFRVETSALQQGRIERDVSDDDQSVWLVASGRAVMQEVAVVDPETRALLPDGQVGEIWVHGDNVGIGYWKKPEQTEELFGARLEQGGDLPAEGWLRTEDLGAMVDDRLVVTGRIKDLIIIDGRNIYPHDIEFTVEQAHDAIAMRRLAAFSVPSNQGEELIVVAERYKGAEDAGENLEEIAAAARQAVSEEHTIAMVDFVLVEPDSIARTSSGKIARKATRAAYLDGSLRSIGNSAADA